MRPLIGVWRGAGFIKLWAGRAFDRLCVRECATARLLFRAELHTVTMSTLLMSNWIILCTCLQRWWESCNRWMNVAETLVHVISHLFAICNLTVENILKFAIFSIHIKWRYLLSTHKHCFLSSLLYDPVPVVFLSSLLYDPVPVVFLSSLLYDPVPVVFLSSLLYDPVPVVFLSSLLYDPVPVVFSILSPLWPGTCGVSILSPLWPGTCGVFYPLTSWLVHTA